MKKTRATVACALAVVTTLTLMPGKPGFFGPDVVSAATGETTTTPTKPTTNPTTPGSLMPIKRLLRYGSLGSEVRTLQTLLNSKGYSLKVDGAFGKLTLAAVKDFQSKNNLVVDGIVGPKTLAKLTEVPAEPTVPTTPTEPQTPPDVVTSASIVDNAAVFAKSIGKDGKWIICTTKDLVVDRDLVLEGEFKNGKVNPDGTEAIQRKIALYTQDDKHNVLERFTLTAPKLTIKSPNARIQGGTFKGDVYVETTDFQLVDAKVDGNIYFISEAAKTGFKIDAKSAVTGKQEVQYLDTVASASIVDDAAVFVKSIGKDGKWIICTTKDLTIYKDLVLEGEFKNGKKNPDGTDAIQRKIALYTQDDKHNVTARFSLTAPKLTIKSPNARIQSGTFKGDVYVETTDFQLVDAKVDGNIYFISEAAKTGFKMDAKSAVTGKQEVQGATAIKIGRADYAAHGTKCFTSAVVAMAGDKIVAASIDDYQFMAKDTSTGVPNSDKDFGTYFKDATRVLGSKRTNTASYSANMANSGATIAIDKNFDAIQEFVKGKTIAQLEEIIKTNGTDPKVDAVTSATLTDTNGYLNAIVAAAKASKENSSIKVDAAALNALKVGRADYAAHGTKCFTAAVVVMAGDKIVGSSIDDYQFMAKDTSIGVPNSDKDFGTYFKDATRVLGSKRTNTVSYSANMANSGATIAIDKNFDAIQAFVAGKTVAELEAIIKTNGTDPKVDAVASATLTDTNGYLNAIAAAAKNAK